MTLKEIGMEKPIALETNFRLGLWTNHIGYILVYHCHIIIIFPTYEWEGSKVNQKIMSYRDK